MTTPAAEPNALESATSGRGAASRPEVGRLVWDWRKAPPPKSDHRREDRSRSLRQALITLLLAGVARLVGWGDLATLISLVALVTFVIAVTVPTHFQGLIRATTWGVGKIVTFVVLSTIYYLVFLPLGLFVRRSAGARFKRAWDAKAESYWKPKTTESSPERTF